MIRKVLIVFLLVVAVGCAKKYTKPSEEAGAPDETVKEEMVTPEGVDEMDEEVVEEVVDLEADDVEETAISVEEQAKSVFKDVLFDYDKYDIKAADRTILNDVAVFLNDNRGLNIVVEGHCDERGTNEYNLALGEKRAKAAKNYLVSLGISPERMIIITFGEEKPVCTEQDDSCWQQNRRAHFVVVTSRFQ